ncbi:peptidyl-dipeptidase Dcp [Pseudoluteimonas lycopersici]|uniref:Dipeptidyl carboxypeptidase n=1 Tax=Pseudoluteimonas lycopersici TaxID=1324796 RepID=A0A516V3C5_9GAMM|nr:peptidyl-dipeptidase Dcp [Lysobacter lycopersici]QDQ73029.1 peptidyl-dipeptidase Dcp [Lysobacter lycopersici]
MNRRPVACALALAIAACFAAPFPAAMAADAPAAASANPFDAPSTLPFQAPDFAKIKDADFAPAFTEAMRRHMDEVAKIADDPDAPTFDNTLVALEKSGQMLSRVNMAFNALTSANTDDALQKTQEDVAPLLAAHFDAIYLNPKLFARIEALYKQRDALKLDPESKRLVEYYYLDFVHNGARLSDADKARLKELNKEESTLDTSFVNKLLAGTKAGALVVDDKAKLAGLSDAEIAAAAQDAAGRKLEGKWVIPLQNTTQQPALQSLTDRDVREQLFKASWLRTEHGDGNDTRDTIARIAQVRAQQAKLLGYDSYAAWKLDDQMAKTPETALKFLDDLVPAATARAKREATDIQAMIDKDGGKFQLQPWDWQLYAEQVRKAKYDLDESQIKPYFELNNVLENGVFYAAHQLYGLDFKERHDLPVYQPDVRVFEVFDADGKSLALFYCDYFKRDNKSGGAWMDNLVGQSKLLGTKPVIYNVTNFTKPAPGQPALLSFDDVTTMFHEFGHALHGMFADQQYPSLSGTSVARDFVEFPSQFNEHWALEPSVFAHYAKHYQTGAPMPQDLVDKIKKSGTFNKGYDVTEAISAALLDMSWHTLPADAPKQDVDAFEAAALKKNGTDLSYVPPRYRSSYFMHIWGNGYAAGYYAYSWTQMLADDAFAWFDEHGGLTRANGDRFRQMVLSRGNTEDLATMYRDWRGRDPNVDAMKKDRGLEGDDQ